MFTKSGLVNLVSRKYDYYIVLYRRHTWHATLLEGVKEMHCVRCIFVYMLSEKYVQINKLRTVL